jgi:hypothetical protein
VWDAVTDKPAEANEMRYINLRYAKAVEDAASLNGKAD